MIRYDSKRKTYYVQIDTKDPTTGKRKQVTKRGFKLKREAKEWEADYLKAKELPTLATFKEIVSLWESSNDASTGTIIKHREHFENRFSDLYKLPIEEITRPVLVRWRDSLSKTNYSTVTKNRTISYVKSVFRFANQVYSISDSSVILKPFKKTNEELMHEMSVWTPEEFNQFIKCVDNRLYQLFFETLFWTGMRRGEAIALQKSDFKDGWINIHYSQRTATEGLKPTKTKASRKIQVDEELEKELNRLKEFPGEYMFGGEYPLSPSMIDSIFKKGIKESKVKPIRLHDLRHSHATWLINNGVNIVAVSKRLGHASIEQTLKTYTHLLKSSEDELLAKINEYKS